jgi:hypothetical protein
MAFTHCAPFRHIAPQTRFGDSNILIDHILAMQSSIGGDKWPSHLSSIGLLARRRYRGLKCECPKAYGAATPLVPSSGSRTRTRTPLVGYRIRSMNPASLAPWSKVLICSISFRLRRPWGIYALKACESTFSSVGLGSLVSCGYIRCCLFRRGLFNSNPGGNGNRQRHVE